MNTENLQVATYSNYKTMCEILQEPYYANSGNAKIKQLEDWKRYFDYTKQGIKFTVHEIYGTPGAKQIKARNSKYTPIINHLLLQMDGYTGTAVNLMHDMGMMSDHFYQIYRNNTNLDDTAIGFIYSGISTKLNNALNSLHKNKIIDLEVYHVKVNSWERLTEEEEKQLEEIEKESMWEYQLSKGRKTATSLVQIRFEWGITEYMQIRNNKINDVFGCKVIRQYHITITNNAVYKLDAALERLTEEELKTELNKRINASLLQTLSKRINKDNSESERITGSKERIKKYIDINTYIAPQPAQETRKTEIEILEKLGGWQDEEEVPQQEFEFYENKHKSKPRKGLLEYE